MNETFIYSEMISEDLCDKLVHFFNNNSERQKPDDECKGKKSSEIVLTRKDDIFLEYDHHLSRVLNSYLEKYKYSNSVAKFKTSTFEATEVVKNTEVGEYAYIAKGKLTIKGVAKDVELLFNYFGFKEEPAFDETGKETGTFLVSGFEGEMIINRNDFGIEGGGAADNVEIGFTLEAYRMK